MKFWFCFIHDVNFVHTGYTNNEKPTKLGTHLDSSNPDILASKYPRESFSNPYQHLYRDTKQVKAE